MSIQHNIDSNAQGQRLRLIRNLTMLSRRAFAKKHNLNISAYQAWEDGRYKKGISLSNASKIISAAKQHNFNCTAEWLLYGIGEPPSQQKNINFHANINEQEHILKEAAINNKIRELNTCLINAIKKNNLLECKKLIQQGANLHLLDRDSLYLYFQREDSALHWAAIYAKENIIKLFVELGLKPDLRNKYLETPLHYAAFEGNLEAAKTLVQLGADIEQASQRGTTPPMWAAYAGQYNTTEFLLNQGASLEKADFNGRTALHWAAFKGQTTTGELLITALRLIQKAISTSHP